MVGVWHNKTMFSGFSDDVQISDMA